MTINIGLIILTIVAASLSWYANEKLNTIPYLKGVIQVLIVVISVYYLLIGIGLIGGHLTVKV